MSKIAEVAPALTALKARLEQRADQLLQRIASHDRKAEGAYAIAEQHMDAQEAEMSAMESELRQLGNMPPLERSAPQSGEAAPNSAAPKS